MINSRLPSNLVNTASTLHSKSLRIYGDGGSLTLRRLVMAIRTHHTIFLYLCPVFYIFPFGPGQIPCHTEGGGCTWGLMLVTIGWVGTDTDHPSPDTRGDQCLSTVSTLARVFSDCYRCSLEPFTIYFLPNPSFSQSCPIPKRCGICDLLTVCCLTLSV